MTLVRRITSYHLKAATALAFFTAASTVPAIAGKSCHCRTANSEKVAVGNTTCLKTHEGLREARCEFVLNNTAWKLTGNLCPLGHLPSFQTNQKINLAKIDFKTPKK